MTRHGKRPSPTGMFRAAAILELSDLTLARILRCSGETVARYRQGADLVWAELHTEMAQGLMEVSDLIPGFVEPGQTPARWLRAFNNELDAVSLHVLEHEWGLDDLLAWLRGDWFTRPYQTASDKPRREQSARRPAPEHPSAAAPKPTADG